MKDKKDFELIEASNERRLPTPYVQQPGDLIPYLVFGFDLGIASCGWCVLDFANHRLVAMNSYLFDAPQDGKTKESLAAQRRGFRSQRRSISRGRARRRRAVEILKEAGLMPQDADAAWLQTRKGELHPLSRCTAKKAPIRVRALDEPVSDRQLAQALYSICSHRGYIPHGEGKGDAELGKVRTALEANEKEMKEHGWRTVGEMLAARGRSRNRKGDYSKCVRNADLVAECKLIVDRQRELGNVKASRELERRLVEEVLTYLTDATAQEAKIYASVKRCPYFPEEPAAPSSAPSNEMCIAWEKLAAMRMSTVGGQEHPLPRDVVEAAMRTLFSPEPIKGNKDCKITYKRLRKTLDAAGSALAGSEWLFKGVSPADEGDEVCKPSGWRALRGNLPPESMQELANDIELADAVACALAYSYSAATLESLLGCDADAPEVAGCAALGRASDALRAAAAQLPYSSKVFSGYGRRSLRALAMIREEFEQGAAGLHDACEATGLYYKQTAHGELFDFLPAYETFDPTCKNPAVLRAMRCFRQCLNALIRTYGRPAEIHVELARELKVPKAKREEDSKKNAARKKKKDEARKLIAEKRGVPESEVSGKEVLKRLLWEEFEGIDPFSGEKIVEDRCILDPHYAEIDHILPYSRTFDDSIQNKVLVLAKSNQDKGERSPREALDDEDFAAMAARARGALEAKRITQRKFEKLTCIDLEGKQDGFIERNLVDTRHMTKACSDWVRTSLRFAAEAGDADAKQRVFTPAGQITGMLRRAWGFDGKDREDLRHHALDAALIAAASQATVKRAAEASSKKKVLKKEDRAAYVAASAPWPGFRHQVEEALGRAVPAHAPNRKVGGEVADATTYRLLAEEEGKATYYRKKDGSVHTSTSYLKTADGKGVQLRGDHAFLQLWWDPEGKPPRKGMPKGRWYADPVLVRDMPAVKDGSYMPRIAKKNVPREQWELVPECVRMGGSLKLHHGDLLLVGGKLRRYLSFDISNAAWKLIGPMQGLPEDAGRAKAFRAQAVNGLAFGQFAKDEILVIDASPLGWPGYIG